MKINLIDKADLPLRHFWRCIKSGWICDGDFGKKSGFLGDPNGVW